ncbi:MAG: proton-conducting transporter membrane subunit, partial [Berryella intestinalis]|nr:proton-conducting transporter membrane subunit [Berryella intestinalis]
LLIRALMFIFLSAMFVIVFSNNLAWVFSGWEVTTVCSFLLIGYTRTQEAIDNSFRQIMMNMAGGIAFAVGLMLVAADFHTLSMADFIALGVEYPQIAAVPACAFAFAGLTKAAQMPFHTWLLGAMVAPTPTSALLHSSTMVKAGVFLLVKLAPIFFVCPAPSLMVIGVGGLTFLICSFMAISQSNAKRVLAYSTVANLGLIVACAGVGTAEAVWAAILLIVFHAAAKSLLFLCVGTAEHHIGSRDIEDMDLLFERMPRLARYMMIGIMCMFIAPFGMLIAKWAALVSFADTHQFALIMFLAFGSGATFLFWAKWLGKLSGIAAAQDNVEMDVHTSEWVAVNVMAAAALVSTILLPVFSFVFAEPYIVGVFGTLGQNIATDNLWVASILAAFSLVVFFARIKRTTQQKGEVYLSGVAIDGDARTFSDSLTREATASTRNMYLEEYFGEARWRPIGEAACAAVIVCCFLYGFVQFGLFA